MGENLRTAGPNDKSKVARHLGWVKGIYRRWLRYSNRRKPKDAAKEEENGQR